MRVEWGVMVDRRSRGLGVMLATTCSSRVTAERDAIRVGATYSEFPVFIQWREVVKTEWRTDWMDGLAHEPECNDRCDNTGHYLTATPPTTRPDEESQR